ncbi:hypothetical protein B0T22DRAFT_492431 [Podospora appendiculata]|uniref:Uncharacterized protein n=1 Tax=Podospora appendiculata TaxID=314037 RepID=A0AAE1CAE4_9PEZI|nr:hypothetical protein B0T22DRAFT_492431 [Podospora appendiculata]
MSLVDRTLPLREQLPANMSSIRTLDGRPEPAFSSQHPPYHHHEAIFTNFYGMDDHETLAPSPKRVRSDADAPALPQKSSLRASRLLDNLGLKLGGSVEAAAEMALSTPTPLDAYLSSEEDASSDADDFSDYGYDSSNEDVASPTRRSSQEDTARVVSVIYSGKPSIVDLSLRRSMSPSSLEAWKRTSIASSTTTTTATTTTTTAPSIPRRPVSSASFTTPPFPSQRKNSLLADMMSKKRPPFLNIDPYANGSTYSLDLPQSSSSSSSYPAEEESPVKPPKTPTQQLLKGVSRTFSLVRKRSRPILNGFAPQPTTTTAAPPSLPPRDQFPVPPSRRSFTVTVGPSRDSLGARPASRHAESMELPKTPQTPVTYNDIVQAAKKNSMMMPPTPPQQHQQQQHPLSPVSPVVGSGGGVKRGILSGLSARRRSIKLVGKLPMGN